MSAAPCSALLSGGAAALGTAAAPAASTAAVAALGICAPLLWRAAPLALARVERPCSKSVACFLSERSRTHHEATVETRIERSWSNPQPPKHISLTNRPEPPALWVDLQS